MFKMTSNAVSYEYPSNNLMEVAIFAFLCHTSNGSEKNWLYQLSNMNEPKIHSVHIKCFGHNEERIISNLTEVETFIWTLVFHTSHEGCHIAVKVDDNQWIKACNDHLI